MQINALKISLHFLSFSYSFFVCSAFQKNLIAMFQIYCMQKFALYKDNLKEALKLRFSLNKV